MEFLLTTIGGMLKLNRGDGYVYLSLKSPEIDDRSSITVELPTSLRQLGQLMDVEIEKLKLVSHAFEQRGSSTETEIARQGVRKMLRQKLDTLHRTIQRKRFVLHHLNYGQVENGRSPSDDTRSSSSFKQMSETSEENKADFIEQSAKNESRLVFKDASLRTKSSNTTTSTFSTTVNILSLHISLRFLNLSSFRRVEPSIILSND